MPHRFLSHTADLGVEIEAASLDALFADAVAAFSDAITEVDQVAERVARPLSAEAPELPDLLLAWLEELLYLFETEGLIFRRAEARVDHREGAWRAAGEAYGEPWDEARLPLKVLIKAITYHQLEVTRTAQGFRARVIFDI